MKKPKKTKATPLDRIAAQLHAKLKQATKDVIEIGNLLIKSREYLEHGEWQNWLAENFDLTYRTAHNYEAAAEYVAARKSETISHFANLSPTVLYDLATGGYLEEEEKAILAAARKGRVDQYRAKEICNKLKPPVPPVDDARDAEVRRIAWMLKEGADADAEDESEAIIDGPPPKVPSSAPIQTPPNFALDNFDHAVTLLKHIMTKPLAKFADTAHSVEDLKKVEAFIRDVIQARRPS